MTGEGVAWRALTVAPLAVLLVTAGCSAPASTPTPSPTATETVSTEDAYLHDGKWWSLNLLLVNYTEDNGTKEFTGYVAASHLPEGQLTGVEVHALSENRTILERYHVGDIEKNEERYWVNATLPTDTYYVLPTMDNAAVADTYNGSVRGWIIPDDGNPGEYNEANESRFIRNASKP